MTIAGSMEDLSLHILDIAENSLNAGATEVSITIDEDTQSDLLTVEVMDNGKGMDTDTSHNVMDPFYTTRTTRSVGLGLPLLNESARSANGSVKVASVPGKGTTVTATFQLSHIDRKPLGRMADTITAIIAGHPDVDVSYRHERDGASVVLETKDIRERFEDLPLSSTRVLGFIREYLTQEEDDLLHHD